MDLAKCQNCGSVWEEDSLLVAKHLSLRVGPGEPMPSGECPSCGALCQPVELGDVVQVKPRVRSGSWDVFDRRYEPIYVRDGNADRDPDDPLVRELYIRHVWTVVEGDTGRMYVVPGFHMVNRIGLLVTRNKWSDIEESNPGYTY